MKYYVGIDLGTTNSAISTFDGETVKVWTNRKDQTDVTPSAIYIDKRGRRFYGGVAYRKSAQEPERCALFFKRFMGTNTKIKIGDAELTPEECSAEILRELYKNLPEEIRTADDVATVITVPAAFNQMQNAATLEAAKMAGIGKVALMQEPVAAIMSVMKNKNADSNFLIFDLGGGTLDVAIAESISGKVNLLAHGGAALCGGRDMDRALTNQIVMAWIRKNYSIPKNWNTVDKYKKLLRIVNHQAELAKIELSSAESSTVEGETNVVDENGEEIYLDVTVTRKDFDALTAEMIDEAVNVTRETIEKSGLSALDIDRIIFIGGPTKYTPLCEKIVREIGIQGSNDEVNPMTAVSEGAAIFAESIDWTSEMHGRKSSRNTIKSDSSLGLRFIYDARTPDAKARIAVSLDNDVAGYTFEINSVDTGWSSGSIELKNKAKVTVSLTKRGENKFVVTVYDAAGCKVHLANSNIVISQTLATVGAILANHSIGLEVLENVNSSHTNLIYLVRQGDTLPAKGQVKLRAGQDIKAGSYDSLNFNIFEGEIDDNVKDNRFIGCLKIDGTDFDFGKIVAGAEIVCDYSVNDAGTVTLEVEIESVDVFRDKNFYSREAGQIDLNNFAATLNRDGKELLQRVQKIGAIVKNDEDYNRLQHAGEVASTAINANQFDCDAETLQHLNENILQIKRDLSKIRRNNLVDIREYELQDLVEFYEEDIKEHCTAQDNEQFEKLFSTAKNLVSRNDSAFENILQQIRYKNYEVLANDPDFVRFDFERLVANAAMYRDRENFIKLAQAGKNAIENDDIDELRRVNGALWYLRGGRDDDDLKANIVKA